MNYYSLCIWLILTMYISVPILVISGRMHQRPPDPLCKKNDPWTLRPDQVTVVINGYSEHRISLLRSIADLYSASPLVAAVVLLWCNPATSENTLTILRENISAVVLRAPSSSLNHRFYPWGIIKTKAVLICDDDIEPDLDSLSFAFTIWKSNPDRVVGFFARSHAYDVTSKTWIYAMERGKYSIILTKLMILSLDHLETYSCTEKYADARRIVDTTNNCEDILMNFVVAEGTEKGPLMVVAKGGGIRDYGDARNSGVSGEVMVVGLSSRRGEHRKRRGDCITEFHRVLGSMPLKYSYGKVVYGGGEQGLCQKKGLLVLCDHQQDDFR